MFVENVSTSSLARKLESLDHNRRKDFALIKKTIEDLVLQDNANSTGSTDTGSMTSTSSARSGGDQNGSHQVDINFEETLISRETFSKWMKTHQFSDLFEHRDSNELPGRAVRCLG